MFTRFNNTLVPHNGKLLRPSHSNQFDWEAELCRHHRQEVPATCRRQRPFSVIAGYACFNDGSLRDWQRKSGGQFTLVRASTAPAGFGPDIVTSDELPPGGSPLRIMTRVNGKTMQDSNTDDLIFDVPTLVHELTKVMTLDPGDVIITGTPSGVAMARKPPNWLKPGDVCEIEIEKIGVLRNPVIQGALRRIDRGYATSVARSRCDCATASAVGAGRPASGGWRTRWRPRDRRGRG